MGSAKIALAILALHRVIARALRAEQNLLNSNRGVALAGWEKLPWQLSQTNDPANSRPLDPGWRIF